MTWLDANKLANLVAAKAFAELDVDLGGLRVDVVHAVLNAGVRLMWRPMPKLFGAYLSEFDPPGILLNNELPASVRRQTVAHELGHHVLKHTTSVDDGSTIAVGSADGDLIPSSQIPRQWTTIEKQAEAFAAWFLMPRRVVRNGLAVLNLESPTNPVDVYQLSLMMGTPYRTTVRHLVQLRLISSAQAALWEKRNPGQLKSTVDIGARPPVSRRPDVWSLNERFVGHRIETKTGDRIVVSDNIKSTVSTPPWLTSLDVRAGAPPGSHFFEVIGTGPGTGDLVVRPPGKSWTLSLYRPAVPLGLERGDLA